MTDDAILESICGKCGTMATTAIRCTSNNNAVYRLGDTYVIKFTKTASRNAVLEEEANICRILRALDLPVPKVIDEYRINERYCIVYEQFPGRTAEQLSNCILPFSVWHRSATFLSHLHALRYDLLSGQGVVPDFGWDKLTGRLDECGYLDNGLNEAIATMRSVYEKQESIGFCHADYGPSQVMFSDTGEMVVIDWERSGVGNILYSAGRFLAMIDEYVDGDKERMSQQFAQGFQNDGFPGSTEEVIQMQLLSDLRDAHWKFVCGEDHRRHACALVEKVRERIGLTRRCSGRTDVRH